MGKKWRHCSCPPKKYKPFKPLKARELQCKDVTDIIEALTIEALLPKLRKQAMTTPKYFKMKPCRQRHYKDTCVPMVPSMHTRLKYIGHCPLEPPTYDEKLRQTYGKYDFVSTSTDEDDTVGGIMKRKRKKIKYPYYKKRVRYFDLMPGDVMLPTPIPVIKHTASDTSILNVPSPKTSGEVIRAQKASVKPGEHKPPLPPKAGYELFKPHSGLIINQNKDYSPDMNVVNISGMDGRIKKKKRPRCTMKSCRNKKCRKHQAMLRRRARDKPPTGPYRKTGATDGALRARRRGPKPADDDDVCDLDEIPKPEYPRLPKHLRRGTIQTHSLTVLPCTKEIKADIHFGILPGSFNMYDGKFGGRSRGRQAMTMTVMAYCLAFHYHPKQWTMKLVDNLLDAGDVWYIQCLEKVHDHSSVQGICEVLPFGRKQTMVLNGKRMQILLGEPEIVGYTMSLDPRVYNLIRGLKAFFKENRAGVMMSRVLKVIIWKDRVCYYIFDPAGRDSRAFSNFANGKAAIINVKDLDAVSEILLGRSILEDQKFVLAPVKVLKMIDEKVDDDLESDKELTQAEKAMMGYRIMNETCAIVNANLHLGDRCFEEAKFRQAIPIAIVAMTYSKISPPNTWFSRTLDKILRLGNKLYMQCAHPKILTDLTIDNIPNEIYVGPYACEIIIYRERIKGQLFSPKDCFLNIRTGLQEFFAQKYNSGIVDFNNYSLAVWKQKDMYYLFDPYPRSTDGLRTTRGKACCVMGLNPETLANSIIQNFDYLPVTTQFVIHAFKVLKLKKKQPKTQITCTLSNEDVAAKKAKRTILPVCTTGSRTMSMTDMPVETYNLPSKPKDVEDKDGRPPIDEEHMGDIISLVDSIQEDYLPPIPLRYKKEEEAAEPKVVNLDSPTVSVTQIVPPWPKPRDKTNEPPEPDPDPEPSPPPTPPPVVPPEGAEEEEEDVEEEEDEETAAARKEEEARKKAEEEEARRKAEELPPPMPPPPPSPQPEPEVPLVLPPVQVAEDEEDDFTIANVDRRILLTQDAKYRFKLRQIRKKMTAPLAETYYETPFEKELAAPTNFKELPDRSQIIRGHNALSTPGDANSMDYLPFGAIMAIVTSYKYAINTWSSSIVNFVVDTAKKLYDNKQEKFQLAPVHIIPKIGIGHQAFHAIVDVVGEGPSWQLEDILDRKFFAKYDRGMVTTATYSCAIFRKGGLYYLFDGSPCNAMGLRDEKKGNKGKACFLRFRSIRDLAYRITFNKDGRSEDQQFVLSRIIVRRLLKEPRHQLPEDYDYATRRTKEAKSKTTIVASKGDKKSSIDDQAATIPLPVGYQRVDGIYRIEGTTSLTDRKPSEDVKSCHFVSLMAMLMATMHPIRTWDQVMVDTCIEKGLEIREKATNLSVCEKRVIKNVILDGKFMNVNIKKILVVNENPEKRLEQYLRAVLKRLRYVMIRYPQCSMVICQTGGYYHLFDPYPPPSEEPQLDEDKKPSKKGSSVATWTLYRSIDALIRRIRKVVPSKTSDEPEFYTFELTSVKTAPRHSALNYRLSPLFKPDENPNVPYLKRKRARPPVGEKMYWLNIEIVPWSRMSYLNDLGFQRGIPKTLWKAWDIEFPGDLYSLWGTIHPLDERFKEKNRGMQYLATSVLAIGMTQACDISAWTGGFLDGIVIAGDKYHDKYMATVGDEPNHEVQLEKMDTKFDDMYPYTFKFKFDKVVFGFVYNILEDRFNLSKALSYFFESKSLGILTSTKKNLAFGRIGKSYFMFDCQSHGAPIFCPGQGSAYILRCESLNRLIYCMTITLNIRSHGQQFHLYSVDVTVGEISK